jgi:hypothetical protein
MSIRGYIAESANNDAFHMQRGQMGTCMGSASLGERSASHIQISDAQAFRMRDVVQFSEEEGLYPNG